MRKDRGAGSRRRSEPTPPRGTVKTSMAVSKEKENESRRRRTTETSTSSTSRHSPRSRHESDTGRKRRRSSTSPASTSSDARRRRYSASPSVETASSRRGRSRSRRSEGDRVDEEIVVPSTSGVLGDTGIPKSYPGFYELREGMAIQHMTGGPFCGGWSSLPLVNSLRKLVEKINFYAKSDESEIVSYLYNEQAFKSAILSGVNEETTIYTLVAVFNNTMTKDHAILQRMLEKSEHYVSFVQFLEDFKKRKFPEFKLLIVREAELCRQRKNDTFNRYAQKWEIMAKQAKWDLEERLPHFISGMINKDTQNKCNSIALGKRTFDQVRDYAAEYEQRRSESTSFAL